MYTFVNPAHESDQLKLSESIRSANERQLSDEPFLTDEEIKAQTSCCSFLFLRRLWDTYDKTFLLTLGLQYFNNGFNIIIVLGYMYRFKNFYHLEPAQTSQYTALISLPWSLKLFYGLFTDTFPLFGSRKRNYMILMGIV